MTALLVPPIRPLTVADYLALPEDAEIRYELQEGALVPVPSPGIDHQDALVHLYVRLDPQVPASLVLLGAVDIDLQLDPPEQPGTVRVPDAVVITRSAYDRVHHDGGLLRASDVRLAVEIISHSSRRTDTVLKRREYADAGIPYYWVIDIEDRERIALTAHRHAGEVGYRDDPPFTGTFRTEVPFPVEIDLDGLL